MFFFLLIGEIEARNVSANHKTLQSKTQSWNYLGRCKNCYVCKNIGLYFKCVAIFFHCKGPQGVTRLCKDCEQQAFQVSSPLLRCSLKIWNIWKLTCLQITVATNNTLKWRLCEPMWASEKQIFKWRHDPLCCNSNLSNLTRKKTGLQWHSNPNPTHGLCVTPCQLLWKEVTWHTTDLNKKIAHV